MKKIALFFLCAAVLTLTACGKTDSVSESAPPQSASGYIPPVVSEPPESVLESTSDGGAESSSDTASDSVPESGGERIYRIGDLVGPEDLPSRGTAAYIAEITTVHIVDGEYTTTAAEIYDEHDNVLCKYGDKYCSYEYDRDGRVVREYSFWGSSRDIYEYEYDENGLETVTRCFDIDGSLSFVLEHLYDEHGEYSQCIETYYLDDGSVVGPRLMMDYRLEYDENGRKIAAAEYNGDEIEATTVFEYEGDTLKREVETIPRDDGKRIKEYEYDADGKIVKFTSSNYNADGTLKNSTCEERTYNADGKIAQSIYYYDGSSEPSLKEIYEYSYEN